MSQTLTKPILLDETGQAIKTALQNIDETESQDWLLTYEDVHSEMDDNIASIAGSLSDIKDILNLQGRTPVGDIMIMSYPTKTTYMKDEILDLTGLSIGIGMANEFNIIYYDITNDCTIVPASGTVLSTLGEQTITITWVGSSQTYTKTFTIDVVPCKIVFWDDEDATEAELSAMLNAYYAGDLNIYKYWSIGDERTIHLSEMSAMSPLIDPHQEQDVTFVLANAGGKELTTSINGTSECAFVVIMKTNLMYGSGNERKGYFHSSLASPGVGWEDCDRRTWCNSTFRNAIPANIRNIFKQHKNISVKGGTYTTTAVTTNDYFAYPAANEIMPLDENWQEWTAYNIESQSTQLEWLETSSNRQNWMTTYTRTPDIRDGDTLYMLTYNNNGTFTSSHYDSWNAPLVVGVI